MYYGKGDTRGDEPDSISPLTCKALWHILAYCFGFPARNRPRTELKGEY